LFGGDPRSHAIVENNLKQTESRLGMMTNRRSPNSPTFSSTSPARASKGLALACIGWWLKKVQKQPSHQYTLQLRTAEGKVWIDRIMIYPAIPNPG